MAENADAAQRHLIWIAASVVTTFYLYCVSILMAGNLTTAQQQWTDQLRLSCSIFLPTNPKSVILEISRKRLMLLLRKPPKVRGPGNRSGPSGKE